MKPIPNSIGFLFIFAFAIIYLSKTCDPSTNEQTKIRIINSDTVPVRVYITLGDTKGCIRNVKAIPFIKDTVPGQRGLQGLKNKQIRCGGAWFNFDDRWVVQPCH